MGHQDQMPFHVFQCNHHTHLTQLASFYALCEGQPSTSVFWGCSKKRFIKLVMEKQMVHQAHATSAKNWQEETQHHLIYMLGSLYY